MSDHYIEFQHVFMSFDDRPVLSDVSFFVDRGETAVIMGPAEWGSRFR